MILLKKTILSFFSRSGRFMIVLLFWITAIPISVHAQIEQVPKTTALSSEAPSLRFEQLSTKDGMAQATGNTITQDRNGFLWIATQGGLHRYDGYEFKVFTATPFDTTSLSDSWVWSATEAKNGDLWVTTESGGLNRMNPVTGTAIHYRHDPDDPTSISSDRLFFALEAGNGDLWVGSSNAGLNRMRAGEDGIFSHYRHDSNDLNSLSSDELNWITEDSEKQIWIASSNGVNRLDPETGSIRRYLDNQSKSPDYGNPLNVLNMYSPPGEERIIWLATGNGLVRLEIESGNYERFLIEPNKNGVNPLNFIHEVRPDPKDNNILWVGGPGTGIARFDMRIEEFTSYRQDPVDKNSLSDNNVFSLFLDRSGMMWVGTSSEGINTFNPGAVNFTNVKHIADDPSSLAPGIVWGVYEDNQGTLWVGTDVGSGGHYLTEFNAKTRAVIRHRHNTNDPNTLLPGSLRSFAEDNLGQFWVAGSSGLSLFDRRTGKVKRFIQDRTEENRGRNNIFDLVYFEGEQPNLWVASGGGLDRFNTETGVYTSIPLPIESTSRQVVWTIMKDTQGTVWLGTDEGLFYINGSGKVMLKSAYNPQDITQISNNTIRSIVERSEDPGILWLGLSDGGGLNRFDTKTGKATHITTDDGLAENTIYGILEDDSGTLWMSTNGGISNYDPDTKQFRNYGLDEGLMSLEYSQNAYRKGKSGMLYFGSGNGVTAFAPALLSSNETPPQVVISDIKLFNKSIKTGPNSGLLRPTAEIQKLSLNYNENEVTIDYLALHFANSKKNQYKYQLDGFDTEWVAAGNKRSATYTNLAPGEYTFKVIAANSDGVWNEEGASIQIKVLPPWYRTWWAYILFALLLGVGIFGVDRFQRYRISRKENERSALREAEFRAEAENKRRADTEELSKIGRTITSSLSADKIIETVYENVNVLMDASIFGVGIYNKEKKQLDFPATKEEGEILPAYSNHLDEDHWLSVWCFKNKKEIIISDFEKEYDKYLSSYSAPIVGKSPMSVLYIPLIQQGRTIGVITTQSFTKDAYTEYHVNLLRNLANYAAIALDNASAYRKLDATLSELRSAQQQLVHSEKMASLGELTAGIAHEIQNPLNFVNNFSEVSGELVDEINEEIETGNLDEVKEITADLKQNLEKIYHHGQRASGIVKGMLEHSRTGSSEKELTDINKLADEYLRLSYHGLRAKEKSFNADFKTDFDESLPKVMVVTQDLGRVILNLINNAFYAVSSKSETRSKDYKPTVTVTSRKVGNKIEISVKDNGAGIPDAIKEKIFQPFFTTKPTGQGTGLGLSMSYDIITKGHGGELKVASKEREGTEFVIQLKG
ncbi:MAG: hypothetical protein DRI71_01405 [Bacteroidetes bacterium]|nr:MAG: hypothetical protein DRI71_01405 [Bacteroidota bacterium]